MLVQKKVRKKLDSHSIEAIFLDYSEESKAYCLITTLNRKIIISRDVIFDECIHMEPIKHFEIDQDEESKLIDFNFFKNLSSLQKNSNIIFTISTMFFIISN